MNTIHKFSFEPYQTKLKCSMSPGARIIKAGIQTVKLPEELIDKLLRIRGYDDWVVFWAMLYTDTAQVDRYFELVSTGHPIPGEARAYIDSVQMVNGIVLHLFEISKTVWTGKDIRGGT